MHVNKTRYPELGYCKLASNNWRLVLTLPDEAPSYIGIPYRTKTELLADLEAQYTTRFLPSNQTPKSYYRQDRIFLRGILVQYKAEEGRVLFFREGECSGHAVRPFTTDLDAFLSELAPIMIDHGWITTYDCQEQAVKHGLARW